VPPDSDNFKSAAAGADWSKTFFQVLTDQAGKDAWPISGATFILMFKAQDKPDSAANTLKFFDWAYMNGDKMADELEYVPLPAAVKDLARKSWAANIKDTAGKPIAWK
jgi:phosphate transport system substrate-binding protein